MMEKLFEDGRILIKEEVQFEEIKRELYEMELIQDYHYIAFYLEKRDQFLIEFDPEAMEEYFEGREK